MHWLVRLYMAVLTWLTWLAWLRHAFYCLAMWNSHFQLDGDARKHLYLARVHVLCKHALEQHGALQTIHIRRLKKKGSDMKTVRPQLSQPYP